MTNGLGHDALAVFDVWEDCRDYLADIVESHDTPRAEVDQLIELSLTGGSEDWNHLVACAQSMRSRGSNSPHQLNGTDVLAYIWQLVGGYELNPLPKKPWAGTDRFIDVARGLARQPYIRAPAILDQPTYIGRSAKLPASKKRASSTSHYWPDCVPDPSYKPVSSENNPAQQGICPAYGVTFRQRNELSQHPKSRDFSFAMASEPTAVQTSRSTGGQSIPSCSSGASGPVRVDKSDVSPYFVSITPQTKQLEKRRPPATISCIPFPSLSASSFGLIQEKFAHDPFWLLIAVTFLIKTAGSLAIPAFYQVKERFPTPTQLIDPCSAADILPMIRHLGLSGVRLAYIQRYAKLFLEKPPKPGIYYKVKYYDQRDVEPPVSHTSTEQEGGQTLEAWEIGHMTQGKYAIDSWRIFCRDELLGRAKDWNGKGREGEFQPEWMRVRPNDKELRAYLRWMWMREGWEWDPVTGERMILRDELREAVEENRVEYDNTGGLRILGNGV